MIFDLHNDFATVLNARDCKKYYRDNHGNVIVAAIWTSEMRGDMCVQIDGIVNKLHTAHNGKYTPVAIEDIGFSAERDLYKTFPFGKYFYCSLTWNYDNAFAGGALDNGRLTEKGKAVIEYIRHAGCIVDLAHLNKKSFFDVIDRIEQRVLCSHTGFNKHPRSLDDSMIREIIARNGVIGLCLVKSFTDAETDIQFVGVIDRYVQKYGIDSLALGTDFYGSTDLTAGLTDYARLDCIRYGLYALGYTDVDVNKIFGNNAQKLFE